VLSAFECLVDLPLDIGGHLALDLFHIRFDALPVGRDEIITRENETTRCASDRRSLVVIVSRKLIASTGRTFQINTTIVLATYHIESPKFNLQTHFTTHQAGEQEFTCLAEIFILGGKRLHLLKLQQSNLIEIVHQGLRRQDHLNPMDIVTI
jgi:hypothetical protein